MRPQPGFLAARLLAALVWSAAPAPADTGPNSGTPMRTSFLAVSAGANSGPALAAEGSVLSWGSDAAGQISRMPTDTGHFRLSAGASHVLALDRDVPFLAIQGLVAGGSATVTLAGVEAGNCLLWADSLAGGVGYLTDIGLLNLTPPYQSSVPRFATGIGSNSWPVAVPPDAAGYPVWSHGQDLSAGILSAGRARTVR